MPISISKHLRVDRSRFNQTGALDAILDVDSKLFIDPHLLGSTEAPELRGAYDKLLKRFADVIKLLALSQRQDDLFWRRAAAKLSFREIQGLCIGYSSNGTSGSGVGTRLTDHLLVTAKAIVDAGITDPEIFELMGLLEPGIGADRISDMIASVIVDDLLAYSERIFADLGVPTREYRSRVRSYQLAPNPFNRSPIILVPKDVLRDLPAAYSWSDIDYVVATNEELRSRLNEVIGETWKKATRIPKDTLRAFLLDHPDLIRSLLDSYRKKSAVPYDFESDPSGQIVWYAASREITHRNPLLLTLAAKPTVDDVLAVVLTIVGKFKDLIENNKLYELLYDSKGNPKHEEAAQLVFYGVADSYCEANNLDLTRESNGGRGPLDFKISSGYKSRVVVEAKLTTNNQLLHGFTTQIQEYQKAEKTKYAVYLVIDVGGPRTRIEQLKQLVADSKANGDRVPDVIFVDAKPRLSASKFRNHEAA